MQERELCAGLLPCWESIFSSDLGGLITWPTHLAQPSGRAGWQLPHLITVSSARGKRGSRKQRWPHWLLVPVPETATANPLFTNEETEDPRVVWELAQISSPLTHLDTSQHRGKPLVATRSLLGL